MFKNKKLILALLLGLSGLFLFAFPLLWVLFPENRAIAYIDGTLLLIALGLLLWQNRSALRSRSIAYGTHSLVTVLLTVSLVGVVNFFVYRNPNKIDLTESKKFTLSDHTAKLIKGLTEPVHAILFTNLAGQHNHRALLDGYRSFNPEMFKVEYVDPDREPTRAKAAGLKTPKETLVLYAGNPELENTKKELLETIAEKEITNSIAKLKKKGTSTVCFVTGHEERQLTSKEAEGLEIVRSELEGTSYKVEELSLAQQPEVPSKCSAIAIMGPQRGFLDAEVDAISKFLENGGRAIIAVDFDVQGKETAADLLPLLRKWHVQAEKALIVDPLSRMVGLDAATPILPEFARSHPVTKEFRTDVRKTNCFFPITRPLEVLPKHPKTLKVEWLAKTTAQSWGETDLAALAKGRVQMTEGKDLKGPMIGAIAVSGNLSGDDKVKTEARMVVFGTSLFATNKYVRLGLNLDFVLNSINWLLEDESSIGIRPTEEKLGKVELTKTEQMVIFWLIVVFAPALLILGGILFWRYRRKL